MEAGFAASLLSSSTQSLGSGCELSPPDWAWLLCFALSTLVWDIPSTQAGVRHNVPCVPPAGDAPASARSPALALVAPGAVDAAVESSAARWDLSPGSF